MTGQVLGSDWVTFCQSNLTTLLSVIQSNQTQTSYTLCQCTLFNAVRISDVHRGQTIHLEII